MTGSDPGRGSVSYELTVVGAVCPAVRCVLQPLAQVSAEVHTILSGGAAHRDLVDLVRDLASAGLEISEITSSDVPGAG